MFSTFSSCFFTSFLVFMFRSSRDRDLLSSDEYFAVSAMCSVLTCGPVFDANAISDERGYIFGWTDVLISSQNEKVKTFVNVLDIISA